MDKVSLVFFATPEIAIDTLNYLADSDLVDLKLVVSMPDRPAGRGKKLKSPDIITRAKELNIETLQAENINRSDEFQVWCRENKIDIFLVFAFAQFLESKILHHPTIGAFNIHTSLLPKYRGAAPIQYALFNGDKSTGITIQKMVKKMDAGNIVESLELDIDDSDNLGSLHDKFRIMSPIAVRHFLENVASGTIQEHIQDEGLVSFAPSIPKNETLFDYSKYNAIDLHNRVRGLSPVPCAYFFLNNKRVKVFETELIQHELPCGELNTQFNTIAIGTTSGSLRIKTLQVEGKSKCSDIQFLNGLKSSSNIELIPSLEKVSQ